MYRDNLAKIFRDYWAGLSKYLAPWAIKSSFTRRGVHFLLFSERESRQFGQKKKLNKYKNVSNAGHEMKFSRSLLNFIVAWSHLNVCDSNALLGMISKSAIWVSMRWVHQNTRSIKLERRTSEKMDVVRRKETDPVSFSRDFIYNWSNWFKQYTVDGFYKYGII